MFRRRSSNDPVTTPTRSRPVERVTSVLGAGTSWNGRLGGVGGVRVEGAFEGEVALRGLLVVGEQGRVTCEHVRANTVVVAGLLKGNITAKKVEIRATGRIWGDVVTAAFSTEEGAFLRGKITMEEDVEIGLAAYFEDELGEEDTEGPVSEPAG
ncbi:MAG TPA: polymer-forming cytoskeletal protein [Anaerolineales bacterium]|nr:polymer-forming cytoskeletal protein [Anaerolineales bacterium]